MQNKSEKTYKNTRKLKTNIIYWVMEGFNGNILRSWTKFLVHDQQLVLKFCWRHWIHNLRMTHRAMKLILENRKMDTIIQLMTVLWTTWTVVKQWKWHSYCNYVGVGHLLRIVVDQVAKSLMTVIKEVAVVSKEGSARGVREKYWKM